MNNHHLDPKIVTAMTIGDYPEHLAVGFLKNQGMLKSDDVIEVVEYDEELEVVVVRTERESNYEEKLSKKTNVPLLCTRKSEHARLRAYLYFFFNCMCSVR